MNGRARFVCAAALAAAVALPRGASAQDAQQSPQTQGPMTVERQHDGFAAAPEVEVGRVGSTTATMAGGYGGWVIDSTLLIGGGAYFQVNRSAARKMDYGGFVLEWTAHASHAVGFGARALVGGGEATLSDQVNIVVPTPAFRVDGRFDHFDFRNQIVPVRLTTGFFVAEPQADLLLNFSRLARLRIGAGYRAVGGARGRESELRGATGSIAVVFGGGPTSH